MYRPPAFDVGDRAALHDLVDSLGPAHLVSLDDGGFDASVVPMVLDRDAGSLGRLRGHLSRANPQWRAFGSGRPALAVFAGPHAYVSPSWYPSKRRDARVVPTWNYVVVHVHGEVVVREDPAWLRTLLDDLTEKHERGRPEPWTVDDAPAEFVAAMQRAVVGIEMRIERIEGKRKLSQNQSPENVRGVLAGLEADGSDGTAAVVRRMRAP